MILDTAVIIIYILTINVIGFMSSRVKTMDDYFLGHRTVPWPVACFSIVATETSTLTFISIPGLAYITNMSFLQVALGYIAGRFLVAFLLLPRYFEGNIQSTYHFLQQRFNPATRRIMAVVFHVTRLLADSIRLFATAIPLAMLLGMKGSYVPAIMIIGGATFFYTLYGGIRSVVIVDSVQLGLYMVCAFLGIGLIVNYTGSGFSGMVSLIPEDNLVLFSSGLSGIKEFFGTYNIFSGIIGGAMLSFASHGTDHLLVQRVLSCRDLGAARRAMITSGFMVFFQFALFLFLGLSIKALLGNQSFERPDEILPFFIINHLPAGVKGLMLAGIFAAAMSTLSSSINSLSSSTAYDIMNISEKDYSEGKKIRLSRWISLLWTAVIIFIASMLQDTKSPLVELGLGIASITYGGLLAIFVQGALYRRFSDRAALTGVALSMAVVPAAGHFLNIFWPWFVPLGFITAIVTGHIVYSIGVDKN